MKAWVIQQIQTMEGPGLPLVKMDVPDPEPGPYEILIRVHTCGVCHTELDEIEGRTPPPFLPVIPGHQVVGRIMAAGEKVKKFRIGDRVGVSWIYSACGKCDFCLKGLENLCPEFRATGRDANGGYAEMMTISQDFCFPIPGFFTDVQVAPFFCAGAIGYRSLRLANLNDGALLGLSGFGASGHLVLKMARILFPSSGFFVFARSEKERKLAKRLGAGWTGDHSQPSPVLLDAIIDTTPVWTPVIQAMEYLKPGGRLVINAIRKEGADQEVFRKLSYEKHLWMEKEIKSVANITRKDVKEFLNLAAINKMVPETEVYPFEEANRALKELKQGNIHGAKVILING